MQKQDCFYLGKVSRAHGIKGSWIVQLDTDEPESYAQLESVFVELAGILVLSFLRSCRSLPKNRLLVQFDSTTKDENLVNRALYLPLERLPPLSGGRFYYHEVIGFGVEDVCKGFIGVIQNINDQSPQALFEIDFKGKQILIPVMDAFIKEINRPERRILVDTPEGLIDLYLR
ncbi:MAG: ribosome maturation factor RimM [Flavobacteriales bacterium AspAUS03]